VHPNGVLRGRGRTIEWLDDTFAARERFPLTLTSAQRLNGISVDTNGALRVGVREGDLDEVWTVAVDGTVQSKVARPPGKVLTPSGTVEITWMKAMGSDLPSVTASRVSDGTQLWTLRNQDLVAIDHVDLTPDDGVIVFGSFSGTIDLGAGTTPLTTPVGTLAPIMTRLDASGTPLWVRQDRILGPMRFLSDGKLMIAASAGGPVGALGKGVLITLDATGMEIERVDLDLEALHLVSLLFEERGTYVSGNVDEENLALASIAGGHVQWLIRNNVEVTGNSSLSLLGMSDTSLYGIISLYTDDCVSDGACGDATITIGDVSFSLTGSAIVRIRR